MMADLIEISEDDAEDGSEPTYEVRLDGVPADLYDNESFDRLVDAHAFAEQVSKETGIPITWSCIRPGWA